MNSENQVITVDAGNTSIKVAVFENGSLIEVARFQINNLAEYRTFLKKFSSSTIVLSSVLSEQDTQSLIEGNQNVFQITNNAKLPFQIIYESPDTLGIDRLCNAAFLSQQTSECSIAIDIGTCVKFDVYDRKKGYLGGSISPGIQLRYNALNDYTGKLPRLHNKDNTALVGKNTEQSLRSGVMNGVKAEIQGFINQYELLCDDLTFFVTGGDASFFDFHSKKHIFADENLTLKGLYEIYKHNS